MKTSSVLEARFNSMIRPSVHDGQRAYALAFDDPLALALLHALSLFGLLPTGFCNADLRQSVAPLLVFDPVDYDPPGKMTYDLRRLRLQGLIAQIPRSHRCQVTPDGIRIALFFTRGHARLLRTGLSLDQSLASKHRAAPALTKARRAVESLVEELKLDAKLTIKCPKAPSGGLI